MNSIGLKAAQLHGDETVDDARWVAERVALTIKAFPAGHPGIGRIDDYGAGLVLVDAESPGSGEVFDWRLAEGVVDPARLIVSGGLRAENVADAIAHLHPFGVDVCSGVESAPGRKDPVKVRAFVTAARAAAGEDASGAAAGGHSDDPGGPGGPEATGTARSTGGRRGDERRCHGGAVGGRAVRGIRRAVRPRVARRRLRGAGGGLPGRLGRSRASTGSSMPSCATTPGVRRR